MWKIRERSKSDICCYNYETNGHIAVECNGKNVALIVKATTTLLQIVENQNRLYHQWEEENFQRESQRKYTKQGRWKKKKGGNFQRKSRGKYTRQERDEISMRTSDEATMKASEIPTNMGLHGISEIYEKGKGKSERYHLRLLDFTIDRK